MEVAGEPSACNRATGAGCVNPAPGTSFYPIYTTHNFAGNRACNWQLGGAQIPGTSNTFGGSSSTEYGALLNLTYPGIGFQPIQRFNDFRQVLGGNPCPSLNFMDQG